jgi:hypothetical protein
MFRDVIISNSFIVDEEGYHLKINPEKQNGYCSSTDSEETPEFDTVLIEGFDVSKATTEQLVEFINGQDESLFCYFNFF